MRVNFTMVASMLRKTEEVGQDLNSMLGPHDLIIGNVKMNLDP